MLLRITVRTGFTCFSRHGTWGKKKEFNPLGKSFLSLIMHYMHKITNLREKNSQKGSPNVNMKNKTGMGRNIFIHCMLLSTRFLLRFQTSQYKMHVHLRGNKSLPINSFFQGFMDLLDSNMYSGFKYRYLHVNVRRYQTSCRVVLLSTTYKK